MRSRTCDAIDKVLGVRAPRQPTFDEKLIQEVLERDPDLQDRVAVRLIHREYGNPADDDMKWIPRTAKFLKNMKDVFGQAETPEPSVLAEVVEAMAEGACSVRYLRPFFRLVRAHQEQERRTETLLPPAGMLRLPRPVNRRLTHYPTCQR